MSKPFASNLGGGRGAAIIKFVIFLAMIVYWFVPLTIWSLVSKWRERKYLWVIPFLAIIAAMNPLGNFIAMFLSVKPFGGVNYKAILWATENILVSNIRLSEIVMGVQVAGLGLAVLTFLYGIFFAEGNFQLRRARYISLSFLLWLGTTIATAYFFKTEIVSYVSKVEPYPFFKWPGTKTIPFDATKITAAENRALIWLSIVYMIGAFNALSSGILMYAIPALIRNRNKFSLKAQMGSFNAPKLSLKALVPKFDGGRNAQGVYEREFRTIAGPVTLYADHDIRRMEDWRAFEYAVTALLKRRYGQAWAVDDLKAQGKLSFPSTSGDQGADVIVEMKDRKTGKVSRMIVQCKYYTKAVGNDAVQQIFAAKNLYQAEFAMLVTNDNVTESCAQLAEANDVYLITGHDLRNMAVQTPAA